MIVDELKNLIGRYDDFPQKGIIFRDVLPVLRNPRVFDKLINKIPKRANIWHKCGKNICIFFFKKDSYIYQQYII